MKFISNHFKYASNVWLTSAILTPCIFGLLMSFDAGFSTEIPVVIILIIPFGIVFSIPNYLIFLFLIWKINTAQLANTEKKIIITFIGIILTFALFMLIFHQPNGVDQDGIFFAIGYSVTLTFGIWFFNLERRASEELFEKKPSPKIKMLEDVLDDEIY